MQYFSEDFIQFFQDLSRNNNKDWFHENKKRYETSVKKPFVAFISKMVEEISQWDSSLSIEPKDCILRINRDIRFSKDKSPYNLHYTAFISSGGRKDKSIPGIFLRCSPQMIGIMGGCFGPSKEQLQKIRIAISQDKGVFRKLIEDKDFIEKFGTIKGDTIKRIPKEWQEAYQRESLIANKQYYFVTEETPDLITSESLLDTLIGYWNIMRPVNEYLIKAMK